MPKIDQPKRRPDSPPLRPKASEPEALPVDTKSDTAPSAGRGGRTTKDARAFAPRSHEVAATRLEAAKVEARIASMPTAGSMSAVRANQGDAPKVAAALKAGLLDPESRVTTRALSGLQVAAAYTEISTRQKQTLGAAGYPRQSIMDFPKLEVRLSTEETKLLLKNLKSQDPAAVAIARRGEADGLIRSDPPNAVRQAIAANSLKAVGDGRLPGSQGREVASGVGVKTFREEFTNEVLPAQKNLETVITEVSRLNSEDPRIDKLLDDPEFQKAIGTDAGKMAAHKAAIETGMTKCPMARGNHAKGLSLDKASMKIDPGAPAWLKEVLGNVLENGKVRISESHSDPLASGTVGHMPGIRFDFPVGNQSLSITANGGAETHENKSIREHTDFSEKVSLPLKDGLPGKVELAGRIIHRIVSPSDRKDLNPATYAGEVADHIRAVLNASKTSRQVLDERFPETTFFARHTYNIGGRNVQLFLKPVDNGYADARGKASPTAYLQTVTDHLAPGKGGKPLEVEVFMIEMQPGDRPELIEEENWKGAATRIGRITVPPQDVALEDPTRSRASTSAEAYFERTPFIPGGNDKVAQGQGVLGRERVVGYAMSAAERTGRPITDFVQFDGNVPKELQDTK
jgi:hypothetical protein